LEKKGGGKKKTRGPKTPRRPKPRGMEEAPDFKAPPRVPPEKRAENFFPGENPPGDIPGGQTPGKKEKTPGNKGGVSQGGENKGGYSGGFPKGGIRKKSVYFEWGGGGGGAPKIKKITIIAARPQHTW